MFWCCVNLPRWGLKLRNTRKLRKLTLMCKFTPLGFETIDGMKTHTVNSKCKFTPLGFETVRNDDVFFNVSECKFTPLGFETH